MYKNHFCLIWKSIGVCFKKAVEELRTNSKVVDNDISDKLVKNFIKYEYKPNKPKKVQSQLTNMVVYDLQTFNTDRAIPYVNSINRLSKLSGIYYRDITD